MEETRETKGKTRRDQRDKKQTNLSRTLYIRQKRLEENRKD